ncbi:MAG TPA: hypothetical protein VKU88_05745 [Acidimicrobiales bacterium]|nr:hypothetical protein [Acidimicrobiales bacterium]
MRPPAVASSRKAVADFEFGGHAIPEGTMVLR